MGSRLPLHAVPDLQLFVVLHSFGISYFDYCHFLLVEVHYTRVSQVFIGMLHGRDLLERVLIHFTLWYLLDLILLASGYIRELFLRAEIAMKDHWAIDQSKLIVI